MGLGTSVRERVRTHQREIHKEKHRIDRELAKLREERVRQCREAKRYAAQGEMTTVNAVVKQLVQTDKQTRIYHNIKLSVNAMSMQLSQVQSTAALQKTLKDSVAVMRKATVGASLNSVGAAVGKYEREMEQNDIKLDMIGDACGEAFGDAAEEEEIRQKILEELQLEITSDLPTAPARAPVREAAPEVASTTPAVYDGVAEALEERLQRLSK